LIASAGTFCCQPRWASGHKLCICHETILLRVGVWCTSHRTQILLNLIFGFSALNHHFLQVFLGSRSL
jgi:hypothetical protein